MSSEVAFAIIAAAQTIALAWILAWQQRAAQEVRKLNGHLEETLKPLVTSAVSAGQSASARSRRSRTKR